MLKNDNSFTLAAALIAVLLVRSGRDLGWTALITGVLLTLILFASNRDEERSIVLSAAWGGVTGYSLATGVMGGIVLSGGALALPWQLVIFFALWVVFALVDRGLTGSPAVPAALPKGRAGYSVFTATPASPTPVPENVSAPPAPTPEPELATPAAPSDSAAPPPQTTPAPPPRAMALPPNVGKPATIYLNITNAGFACLRPVQAEHLGRDFYRVVETPPADEEWAFTTGQIVRCQKRTLSSGGKAMVAFEEAPRADKH